MCRSHAGSITVSSSGLLILVRLIVDRGDVLVHLLNEVRVGMVEHPQAAHGVLDQANGRSSAG